MIHAGSAAIVLLEQRSDGSALRGAGTRAALGGDSRSAATAIREAWERVLEIGDWMHKETVD